MTNVDQPTGAGAVAQHDPGPPGDGGLDRRLLLIASVVVLGSVLVILDATIVNVALQALATDLEAPLTTIQWVVTGYTLALATVIPLSAWTIDHFGAKRTFLASIFLFVLGSALAGAAWNVESLIALRVLQGFGGGLLSPVGMTILTRAAGPARVGRVMAVMGVPMLLGPICGPILGGWLVDDFSWRWIFFINVPVGALAIFLAAKVLDRDEKQAAYSIDWLGVVLLSPGLAAVIYGFAKSGEEGTFLHAQVLVPVLLGGAALAAFVVHALHREAPLVDLRLFANKVFTAATSTLALLVVSVFGGMLLLPLYLQVVRGESAMDTGLLLAPQGLGAMVAMPLAGTLADRTGVGRIVPFGLAAVAASFLGLTQIEGDTSYWLLAALLFLMGLGMGFSMMPTFTGAMQTLRRVDVANASTALNIVQQVAASVGTAVLSVLLARAIADRTGGGGGIGESAAVTDEQRAQAAPLLAEAFGSTFWWALALVVVAFVVATVLLPKRKPAPVDEGPASEPVVLMH
ncbi:DHA2 family efflux MFS transporter permease subunit [Motilibacter deserti]|uniref:DHA2 family efflux MFS transporter permease subunit n=1 Tax=Motilibacter deserti TaxID=2714956 RepID=A0ABX0GU39_9ACTN|nr:DHA2 family efflux MFS transporter permease subunit [Motilibacter deserti]NHC13231.1 DHA2 family efflux MFS transporter permease subunit [Motilibacter deserti]